MYLAARGAPNPHEFFKNTGMLLITEKKKVIGGPGDKVPRRARAEPCQTVGERPPALRHGVTLAEPFLYGLEEIRPDVALALCLWGGVVGAEYVSNSSDQIRSPSLGSRRIQPRGRAIESHLLRRSTANSASAGSTRDDESSVGETSVTGPSTSRCFRIREKHAVARRDVSGKHKATHNDPQI